MKFVKTDAETLKELYEALPDAAKSERYEWHDEENAFLTEAMRIYHNK